MDFPKVLELITGQMGHFIEETSSKDLGMGMEYGVKRKEDNSTRDIIC